MPLSACVISLFVATQIRVSAYFQIADSAISGSESSILFLTSSVAAVFESWLCSASSGWIPGSQETSAITLTAL